MKKILQKFGALDIILVIILLLFTVVIVYPFYNCIVLSFNTGADAMRGHIYFWPREFTLENYKKVLTQDIFSTAAANSILRTVITTVLAIFFTAAYAYVISHRNLMFRKFYMVLGLITMYFSAGVIPTYLVIRDLGLYNNFAVYILPGLFSMFNAVLFYTFFCGIPAALEESAKIDGANEIVVLFRIMMPISMPVIATVALFVAVGQWNSWFDTMLYTKGGSLETLSHMFRKMLESAKYLETQITEASGESLEQLVSSQETNSITLQMAAMVITCFPIIVLYPFLQKYFVKGVMVGSIKG